MHFIHFYLTFGIFEKFLGFFRIDEVFVKFLGLVLLKWFLKHHALHYICIITMFHAFRCVFTLLHYCVLVGFILSDFSDTDLLTIINNRGWETLCGAPVTCPFVIIQEFYSNMH